MKPMFEFEGAFIHVLLGYFAHSLNVEVPYNLLMPPQELQLTLSYLQAIWLQFQVIRL